MSLVCRARASPAIVAECRALRPTARNKASAACPAPSGMKSGRNRCFVDSLRWREVDLNHRFRAWTRFGFGLPDGHRGSHGCGNPRQDRPTQPGATEPRLRQHRPRSAAERVRCELVAARLGASADGSGCSATSRRRCGLRRPVIDFCHRERSNHAESPNRTSGAAARSHARVFCRR